MWTALTKTLLLLTSLHLSASANGTNKPFLFDQPPYNDGIHLAITPSCGNLEGNATDINAGIPPLESFKTIVAFGVSTNAGIHLN
jgi:hypothetical protein